jgi:hypothetical protein
MIAQMLWRRRRNIFRFNDGQSVRAADPIAVAIALHEHKTFLPRHLGEAVDGDAEAMAFVANAACDIFGVTHLAADGNSGLTFAELLELMLGFDGYMELLKKSTERSLTKRGYTESMSSKSSEPTTNAMSDSGPTETGNTFAQQTSSGPESHLHTAI